MNTQSWKNGNIATIFRNHLYENSEVAFEKIFKYLSNFIIFAILPIKNNGKKGILGATLDRPYMSDGSFRVDFYRL